METIYNGYRVCSTGIIYTLKDKPFKCSKNSKGYYRVDLKGKRWLVHRLIATLFIDNPENLPQVNHLDGNKENNDHTNLEWSTGLDNIKHAREVLGVNAFYPGEKHINAKLTEQQVKEIKISELKPSELANKFSVKVITIYKILDGSMWKHIK